MSSGVSDIITSHLPPFILLGDLGVDIQRSNEGHTTTCPCCGSKMFILEHDLVCENDTCEEKAISGVEFVANHSFSGDIGKASKAVAAVFENKKLPVRIIPREVEEQFQKIRQIRKLFKPQNTRDRKRLYLHAMADGWMRKNRLDPDIMASTSCVWTSSDMVKYNLLATPDKPITMADNQFALAIPYYASYSEVGAVLFIIEGRSSPVLHKLDSYRYLWAGLDNIRPGNKGCFVTQNFAKFFQCLAGGRYRHPLFPFLCFLYDGMCSRYKLIPTNPIYLFDPDKDVSLTAPSNLYKDCGSLDVADGRDALTGSQHTPWPKFAMEEATRRLLKEPVSEMLLQFVDSCHLTNSQEKKICKFLNSSGRMDISKHLEKHFSTKLLIEDDKIKVHGGPNGYFSINKKSGVRTDISNFISVPFYNVVFKDSGELLTHMVVSHEGVTFDVDIPLSHLDTPSSFEEAIREGWLASGVSSDIPVLKDRGLFRKLLSRHLKDCASTLPCRPGISNLGWNFKKTEFRGPGWLINSEGVHNDDGILHTGTPFLRRFKTTKFPSTICDEDKCLGNKTLCEFTYILLGYLYRGRFDKKLSSYSMELSKEDKEKLENAARLMGLLTTSLYSDNRSQSDTGNRGIPYLTDSEGKRSLGGIKLLEKEKDSALSNLSVEEVSGWLSKSIAEGASEIMAMHSPFKDVPRRFNDQILLMQEGRLVLIAITGFKTEEIVSPYTHLEKTMENVPYEHIGQLIALDLSSGKLLINGSVLNEAEHLQELWALVGQVEVEKDIYKVGITSMSDPLLSFYQTNHIPYGRYREGEFCEV